MREPERGHSRLEDILSAIQSVEEYTNDFEILWVVIKEDIPLLKEQITKYLGELTEE